MGKILFAEDGWDDYLYWKAQDKKTLKKINKLIKSIERDGPMNGEGKPEKPRFRDDEYSRRINEEDRLVYSVNDDQVEIRSCRGHDD